MRKVKRKRSTPLVFPAGLTAEQQHTLHEKRFLLDIIVPFAQRPRLAYLVRCFTCQHQTTFEVQGRTPLTLDQLHLELILKGWTIAARGYECPECLAQWAQGVATLLQRTPPTVESEAGSAAQYEE